MQTEQQIGPSYKTLIDLWKVEATAGSLVPMLNCMPVLSPYETVIIKKMGYFPVKITGWRRISHKRLGFTAAALYDKFPGSAGLPGAEKPLSHAFIVSHFTFKTYMSVNLTAFTVHICHWAETQIFIKEQKKWYTVRWMCSCTISVMDFFYFVFMIRSFNLSTMYKSQFLLPHLFKHTQIIV